MEIIIAILWYLQVLFIGNFYTNEELGQMINQNQPTIDAIQQDQHLSNQIYQSFDNAADWSIEQDGIDVWEEDEPEPIKN